MEKYGVSSVIQFNKDKDYYNETEFKFKEFFEEAMILFDKNDFNLVEFNLNLALLDSKIDFSFKIKCFSKITKIREFKQDEKNILYFIKKLLNYFKKTSITLIDNTSALSIIKIFFRAGIIQYHKQNYFISYFLFNCCTNLIKEKSINLT